MVVGYGSGRQYGRRGRGSGFRGGRGAPRAAEDADKPREKAKPTFVKLERAARTSRSVFLLAKIEEVKTGVQREHLGKSGRKVTITSTEATVGDETGSIKLYTADENISKFLQEQSGNVVALMNIKFVIYDGNASLEAGSFSTAKTIEQLKEENLISDTHSTTFEINKNVDRTKKPLRKPRLDDIAKLVPEKKGVHLVAKVGTVTVTQNEKGSSVEAVVGTSLASINLVARNENAEALKEGNIVVILNARVTMQNEPKDAKVSKMKLLVDKWGTIKSASEFYDDFFSGYKGEKPTAETVISSKNLSDKQWELKFD